jgi:hypothetical protein
MIDIHDPHQHVGGWRDFLTHLTIITIGLFIALSLEGLVDWFHHRSLVHEAEASLHAEIQSNANSVATLENDIHHQQQELRHDDTVLDAILKTGKPPEHDHMSISFHLSTFDEVSWQTAQETGALSYMPYKVAETYSDIYTTQEQIARAEEVGVRDAILSLAPFTDPTDTGAPAAEEARDIKQHIGILLGQLMLLDSMVKGLDGEYRQFLKAHP